MVKVKQIYVVSQKRLKDLLLIHKTTNPFINTYNPILKPLLLTNLPIALSPLAPNLNLTIIIDLGDRLVFASLWIYTVYAIYYDILAFMSAIYEFRVILKEFLGYFPPEPSVICYLV